MDALMFDEFSAAHSGTLYPPSRLVQHAYQSGGAAFEPQPKVMLSPKGKIVTTGDVTANEIEISVISDLVRNIL
jgi:hypothetical protein